MTEEQKVSKTPVLLVGVDIGSTTTKLAVMTEDTKEMLYTSYRRHNSNQIKSVREAFQNLAEKFPDARLRIAVTGSGARPVSKGLHVPFIQEVVANSLVLRQEYPNVRTAIELGGQDAKIIFFRQSEGENELQVSDMRMNGSCAGGTGAFLDEVASILKIPSEQFHELSEKGTCVYDISGRCGVYAKTDIQPLLNQGTSKADLALSALHAIAKQTIGGLAQGLDIEKPVAFEGGPLTFNPTLVKVFAQRLDLAEEDIILPEQPEMIIARGAAISLNSMFADNETLHTYTEIEEGLQRAEQQNTMDAQVGSIPFFLVKKKKENFRNGRTCRR